MAWEKRSFERQEFLRELLDDVHKKEDEHGFSLFFRLASVIHGYLEARDPYSFDSGGSLLPIQEDHPRGQVAEYFYAVILPRFRTFARTESEANALLARFLDLLTSSIVSRFEGVLRRDELTETEEIKIFGAHRTAEVELETELTDRS